MSSRMTKPVATEQGGGDGGSNEARGDGNGRMCMAWRGLCWRAVKFNLETGVVSITMQFPWFVICNFTPSYISFGMVPTCS